MTGLSWVARAQIIGCFDTDPTTCFVVLEGDASRTMLRAFIPPRLRSAIRLGQPVRVRLMIGSS